MVLDPFCGCTTARVPAHSVGKLCVGIDLSALVAQFVEMPIHWEGALLFKFLRRADVPRGTHSTPCTAAKMVSAPAVVHCFHFAT